MFSSINATPIYTSTISLRDARRKAERDITILIRKEHEVESEVELFAYFLVNDESVLS